MRSLARSLTLSAALLGACVEHPERESHAPNVTDANNVPPTHIGYTDSAVPQIHFPLHETTPPIATGAVPLTDQAAITALPNGGALLVWATNSQSMRPTGRITARTVGPDGALGPVYEVRTIRGTVRGIAIAARGDDALAVWNAEYGGAASQITAQRFRHDGTLVGSIFGIGTYRVIPNQYDAGPSGDMLGFYVDVVPGADGYDVAVRGPMSDCQGTLCVTLRVAAIDHFNDVRGLGGIDDPHPSRPIAFVGGPSTPYSLLATVRAASAHPMLAASGDGPLRGFAGDQGGSLQAAWIDAEGPHAIVGSAPAGRNVGTWLGPRVADSGAGLREPIADATLACRAGAPVAVMRTRGGEHVVPGSALGSPALFAWVANLRRGRPTAAPARIDAMAVIAAGVISVQPSGLALARCEGDALGPFTLLADSAALDGGTQ